MWKYGNIHINTPKKETCPPILLKFGLWHRDIWPPSSSSSYGLLVHSLCHKPVGYVA